MCKNGKPPPPADPGYPDIPDVDIVNFAALLTAFNDENICIMDATRVSDNHHVTLLCSVIQNKDGTHKLTPHAVIIQGDPFELYLPRKGP